MTLKVWEGVFLLFGCTAAGFCKSGKLWLRVRELRELEDDLQRLKLQILYNQLPLMSAAEAVRKERACGFFQMICENQEAGGWEDYGQLWENACQRWFLLTHLKREEQEAWIRLGRLLGRGGLRQQEEILKRCGWELSRLEGEAREELKRRGRMYVAIGMCCGAFLTVILW